MRGSALLSSVLLLGCRADQHPETQRVEGPFAEPRIRILLARQYTNAVGDLLGPAAAEAASPRADVTLNGFDAIGAGQLSLTDADIDEYERSATVVAAVAVADPSNLIPYLNCLPTGPDDADCMRSFVEGFGRLAWRRPLDETELERWTNVGFTAALDFNNFERGLEFIIAGILQSPHFLYQVEVGVPLDDGTGLRQLDGYELASRMSLFLLDTIPSAELLDAAEAGELDNPEGVRTWAETLLEDQRAQAAFDAYFEEVLYLGKLAEIAKDPVTFPGWSPTLASSMKVETIALIHEVVWGRDGDFRDILDAEYTYVDQVLADHYGIDYPGPTGFQKVQVAPGEKRGGIWGHASLLSVLAHVSSSSPTLRGKFIQERMLCVSIPPPPPDVVTELPSAEEAETMRERLSVHLTDPVCESCHSLMDPAGLGLENYDGIGKFRTTDNGAQIDAASHLDGAPFNGALKLGRVIRDRDEFSNCTVLNLYRHGVGHVEAAGEREYLDTVDEEFIASEYRLRRMIVELVASPAFRFVGGQD